MSGWTKAGTVIDRMINDKTIGREDAKPQCERCNDTGMEIAPTSLAPGILKADGKPIELHGPGARRCDCVQVKRLARLRGERLAIIPERYRGVTLATLEAHAHRHPSQPAIVKMLKEQPDGDYFFCGKPDSGKTHFFWTLYQNDVEQNKNVFASTLFKLIEAITDQMFNREPKIVVPDLDVEQISIFLEDVNKARPTEFVAERFFNFIDDVYNRKHRLVVTSQVAPDALAKHFERAEGVDGTAIVRRMVNEDTTVWRMF